MLLVVLPSFGTQVHRHVGVEFWIVGRVAELAYVSLPGSPSSSPKASLSDFFGASPRHRRPSASPSSCTAAAMRPRMHIHAYTGLRVEHLEEKVWNLVLHAEINEASGCRARRCSSVEVRRCMRLRVRASAHRRGTGVVLTGRCTGMMASKVFARAVARRGFSPLCSRSEAAARQVRQSGQWKPMTPRAPAHGRRTSHPYLVALRSPYLPRVAGADDQHILCP